MTYLHHTPEFTLDPIQEAEDCGGGIHAAFSMTQQLSLLSKHAAIDAGDTFLENSIVRYLAIAKRIGFELLYQQQFEVPDEFTVTREEVLYLLMHEPSGTLLRVETYTGSKQRGVNSATLYFVVKNQSTHSLWGGSKESVSNPGWRRDPMCFNAKGILPPADCVYNGYFDAKECLASKFAEILDSTPVKRPIADNFQILEAFSRSVDYSTPIKGKTPTFQEIDDLHKARLFNTSLNKAIFGFSD